MSFTRGIVEHRHTVWALLIGVVIFGAMAYVKLPMQLFPDTAPPLVNVITAYPGAAAEDVAENLSRLYEDEFAALEGVVDVRSTSQDNLSLVSVEFQYGRPVELAAVDVQNAIASIRAKLPAGIREPQVLKFSTNDRPIMTVGIAGAELRAARRLGEDTVAPQIQRIAGVAAVDVFGGYNQALMIDVNPAKLEAHHIAFQSVVDAVRAHNAALPAGTVRTGTEQTMFRVEGRAEDAEDIARIPLHTPDGGRLLVGDLADVRRGALDNDAAFAVNGTEAIALQVFKTEEANTVEVVEAVEALLATLAVEHAAFDFVVGEESASFTRTSISNLLANIWEALLLAAVVIFFFLGRWASSFVATTSMVLSYGMTFALMGLTGTELNMVTLTAIILAVGMVVDAAVVVIENAERKRVEEGLPANEAVIQGTDEIRLAVLAGAGTTLAVLIPLLFLPGFIGKTFGPLALTLVFAFSSSLVVALVVVPVLTSYTVGQASGKTSRLVGPFSRFMEQVRKGYGRVLEVALRRRAMALGIAVLLFAAALVGLRFRGMEVLPKMDSGSFFVALETPSGTALEETRRTVAEVESLLSGEPETLKVQSQAGFEPGMRSFGGTGVQGPTQGFITVTLSPRTARDESVWEIMARVREGVARIPGIQTSVVRELGNTAKSTTAAPVVVRISGEDALVLDRLGGDVLERLRAVPGVVEPTRSWRRDLKRTRVEVDTLRAGLLGLSPAVVAYQMHAGSNGVAAGEFYGDGGKPYPVWVRYAQRETPMPADLLDYPLMVPGSGDMLALRSIASLHESVGQGLITRQVGAPTLEVTAFIRDRALNFVTTDVERALADMVVPKGYAISLVGENRDLAEAGASLGAALLIAVVAVYLLLVAQLKSFLHPLTIMMSVPLSLVGVTAALWIADKPVSMPVMVGLVLLVGTVVNNAIILLTHVGQLREQGVERREALRQSVSTRFRPIMMTSLSTITGMIPLAGGWALGAERFAPLATAVIGGMTASTLLTLIVVPLLYDVFDSAAVRLTAPRIGLARRGWRGSGDRECGN